MRRVDRIILALRQADAEYFHTKVDLTLLREYWTFLAEAASKAAFPAERMKHKPGFIARDIQITEKGKQFLSKEKHA